MARSKAAGAHSPARLLTGRWEAVHTLDLEVVLKQHQLCRILWRSTTSGEKVVTDYLQSSMKPILDITEGGVFLEGFESSLLAAYIGLWFFVMCAISKSLLKLDFFGFKASVWPLIAETQTTPDN